MPCSAIEIFAQNYFFGLLFRNVHTESLFLRLEAFDIRLITRVNFR